jgi:hypothetical protein
MLSPQLKIFRDWDRSPARDGLGCWRTTWTFYKTQGGVIMRFCHCAAILVALLPSAVKGNGFAHNENFIVYTPDHTSQKEDQRFAELLLQRADAFRQKFARQWLGKELPRATGESVIYVSFSLNEDRGLTWAKDHPGRTLHNVYLTTTPEKAVGSTLYHELAHTVLATQFPHPNRLPSWVEEGIASRYDDDSRRAARDQLLRSWSRTGNAPQLAQLLEKDDMRAFDETSYAAATSLVSFLLTKGDERELLTFAVAGQRGGWADALHAHYGIRSHRDLQTQWQAWLAAGGQSN